jgi:hypothetical protein
MQFFRFGDRTLQDGQETATRDGTSESVVRPRLGARLDDPVTGCYCLPKFSLGGSCKSG